MSHRANTNGWHLDGNLSFAGGCDASIPASDLTRNQVAHAYNCTMRRGPISPRPGWKPRPLNFGGDADLEAAFKDALFQHAGVYSHLTNPATISSHGGRLFKINVIDFSVTEITPLKTHAATATTIAPFTIPVAPGTVTVAVSSTENFTEDFANVTIGGYPLYLESIDGATQITVSNHQAANDSVVVANPATIAYNYATSDQNNENMPLGWSVQAGVYWIYQDNQSLPIIFNGTGSRRSDPAKSEVPVGNVMAYAHGRLTVALPDRHTYRVGDLLFGPSGTQGNEYRDAVLKFTENNFLNEGGDYQARVFGAPSNEGPITAMKAIAQTDTQLGQGPLMIGTPYNVFTINLPFDRTIWKDMANPLQTDCPVMGPTNQDGFVLVNTDIWYRSLDGIRSYIMARRQFQQWGNTPMSAEIADILNADTRELLEHGSAVLFDNRLLTTCSPMPKNGHGVFHQGLAVIDFNLVSKLGQNAASPAWEGIWTGLNILKILNVLIRGKEHCFAYVLNCNDEIELWELTVNARFDNIDDPITWKFELPSYNSGDSDKLKKLETSRIVVSNLLGMLDGRVSYRSDLNACWQDWDIFSACAKREDCCADKTTLTAAPFTVPTATGSVVVQVESNEGVSLDFPEVTIGAFTLDIIGIGVGTVTLQNSIAAQNGGYVQAGIEVEYCGYDCEGPHTYREQQRLIRLHMPPDESDPISGHFYNKAYEFQPRFELTGSAEIRQIRIFSKDEPDSLGVDRRNPP